MSTSAVITVFYLDQHGLAKAWDLDQHGFIVECRPEETQIWEGIKVVQPIALDEPLVIEFPHSEERKTTCFTAKGLEIL